MADQFQRLEAPTGLLTASSVARFAGRVEVAEAAYALLRARFVSATAALTSWDSSAIGEYRDASGWFTVTEPCELGGEFSLTGQFQGELVEPTLWGEVTNCGYSSPTGPVWVDAEFLVDGAIASTLEELSGRHSEIAMRGTLRTGVGSESLRVVYAARLLDPVGFRAALRGSGGDVHYERTDVGSTVLIEDLEDFWSCDLTGRRCDSDPLNSLSW
ncbi:MAG: hypothetical protein ACJAYU_001218 [Bradymonadia bacterium]|jgi:hypothetical protein